MEKTTVFNLIILDESGSMQSAHKATVDGCNEVINCARALASEHSDKEKAFMSIYAFQYSAGVPSRYLCKNVPVETVGHITMKDYVPMGCTPLLDAVGSTLVDLRAVASTHSDAYGVVTIITDGQENDSKEYTYKQVAALIAELKEKGWTFNFIGANIDVVKESSRLNIDNAMSFCSDSVGTQAMFADYVTSNKQFHESRIRMEEALPEDCSEEERITLRKKMSMNFFKKR